MSLAALNVDDDLSLTQFYLEAQISGYTTSRSPQSPGCVLIPVPASWAFVCQPVNCDVSYPEANLAGFHPIPGIALAIRCRPGLTPLQSYLNRNGPIQIRGGRPDGVRMLNETESATPRREDL